MPQQAATSRTDSRLQEEPARLTCSQVQGGVGTVFMPVDLPGARAVVFSRPAVGGRGGDVHYVSVCGSGLISRFCLADVVGHGETVAAVSSEIHRVLRRLMNWMDHRRLLRRLNRLLQRKGLDALTTAAVITYFPPSRAFTYSYAGHPPGWHYRRAERTWRRLSLPADEDGDPTAFIDGALGVIDDATFTRSRLRAEPGDRVVLVTDGAIETPGADNEPFGSERIGQVLEKNRGRSLEDLALALINALEHHSADSTLPHDDVTYMAIEFTRRPGMLAQMFRSRLLGLFSRN